MLSLRKTEVLLKLALLLLCCIALIRTQELPNRFRAGEGNRPATGSQQVGATASANALSSIQPEPPAASPAGSGRRPAGVGAAASAGSGRPEDSSPDRAGEENEEVAGEFRPTQPARRRPAGTGRPTNRRPANPPRTPAGSDEEEEECDDDEDEEEHHRKRMFGMNPMRQFSRMWDRVMRQMQPDDELAGGDFGGAMAMGSSFSDGRTTRLATAATDRDGRTRGIFTETRDGRTRTRNFGDDDENNANQEDDY